MSFKKLLFDDLEEIVLPASLLIDPANGDIEAPQDPRFQILKKMDAFVTRAADVSTVNPSTNVREYNFDNRSLSWISSAQCA